MPAGLGDGPPSPLDKKIIDGLREETLHGAALIQRQLTQHLPHPPCRAVQYLRTVVGFLSLAQVKVRRFFGAVAYPGDAFSDTPAHG